VYPELGGTTKAQKAEGGWSPKKARKGGAPLPFVPAISSANQGALHASFMAEGKVECVVNTHVVLECSALASYCAGKQPA
jgi:hypothetical protein